MTYLKYLLPFMGLAATSALAAQVEFVGDFSLDIDPAGNTVTVEIQELRNASRTESTGPLFVSLRYTQCDAPTSSGVPTLEPEEPEEGDRPGVYSLDRVVPGGDSSLAPEASWTDIRFTAAYSAPPSGTYRRHLVVYEADYSESEAGILEQVGSATFPQRHVQVGTDDLDSCFSARPLDAGASHRDYLSLGDRGDYFRLRSYSKGTLQVEFDGNVSAFGELLDAGGRLLESVNVGAESDSFVIERHVDDRVYYVRIAKPWGDAGYYNLHTRVIPGISGAATDRDDDTAQLASPLGLGVEVGDAIDVAGDVDWWSIETHSPGTLVVETTGSTDTHGSLLDSSAEVLVENDDGGEGRNFRIDDPAVFEAGTYYIRVMSSRILHTGTYSLRAVHVPEDGTGRPDLAVGFPNESTLELMPGEPFVLRARTYNRGNGASALTVLRLYRSANRIISTTDLWEGSEEVGPLDALASSEKFASFDGFEQAGTYYVGACVRPVEGESNTDNNCSAPLRAVVGDAAGEVAAEPAVRRYSLPLLLPASDSRRHGFVRMINRSERPGTVSVLAVDDAGIHHGPFELEMDARQTIHFNSGDLESGNPERGIPNGTGAGQGAWRLELTTALDIAPLAYVRTSDGFLTGIYETAETLGDGRYYVPFFNPAANTRQVSSLRVVNPGPEDAGITITGIDDRGQAPPDGEVWLNLAAGEARVITAGELESGTGALQGRFGSGSGKWRLFLSSAARIEVASLLDSPTGNLSNLSSRGRKGSLPLVLPASAVGREGFVRIINWSDSPGHVRIRGVDDTGRRTETVTLSLNASAAAHFNSTDLESGNESKGLSGGIGRGEGAWRLELESGLDLEALAYVRTADGFVTGMHDVAVDVEGIVDVPFFNPGGNTRQASRLRLVNPGGTSAAAVLTGRDDIGREPPYGIARITVPAGESRTITARQLETGADGLSGRLGAGAGKWRLSVASEQPMEVLSLLESPAGNLANLSAAAGKALGPGSADNPE